MGDSLGQPAAMGPLFEKVINLVHALAPKAKIAFNTNPADTAVAIALIVAIYFTCRVLTIREPQKDSDLEFELDDSGESPGPHSLLK
jgi:hypothetical protein